MTRVGSPVVRIPTASTTTKGGSETMASSGALAA